MRSTVALMNSGVLFQFIASSVLFVFDIKSPFRRPILLIKLGQLRQSYIISRLSTYSLQLLFVFILKRDKKVLNQSINAQFICSNKMKIV